MLAALAFCPMAPAPVEPPSPGDPADLAAVRRACRAAIGRIAGGGLLQAGAPAWDLAGAATAGTEWDAELLYADAPLGIGSFVVTWTRR